MSEVNVPAGPVCVSIAASPFAGNYALGIWRRVRLRLDRRLAPDRSLQPANLFPQLVAVVVAFIEVALEAIDFSSEPFDVGYQIVLETGSCLGSDLPAVGDHVQGLLDEHAHDACQP
jgi:hypothetical protein